MIKTMKLLYLFLILFSTLYAQEVRINIDDTTYNKFYKPIYLNDSAKDK